MSDGLFISFEGVDGVGKTTQVQQAHNYLQERGLRSLVTREPGGTPVGLTIRELVLHGLAAFPSVAVTGGTDVVDASDDLAPRTEALLYAADRAEHVAQVVRPALERGDIVLCDRYLDSSLAYQAGGRDLSVDVIRRLSLWASQDLLPKRTYLLDADPSQSKSRLDHGRGWNRLATTFNSMCVRHSCNWRRGNPTGSWLSTPPSPSSRSGRSSKTIWTS